MSDLLIAILGGLGAMLGWGFADFFAKKTIDQLGDMITLAWGHIFGSIALLLVVLYEVLFKNHFAAIPNSSILWLGLILFGISQGLVYFFVFRGFGKGQVALLNPVFASFTGLTALMSIIFYKEKIGGYLPIGLLIIFIGIILITMDFQALRTWKFNLARVPGLKEVGFATILASFWTLFWDRFVGGQDWLSFTVCMYFFMTIAIIIYVTSKKYSLNNIPSYLWKYLILIGVGEIIAYLSLSWGYSATSYTSVVALVSGAFSLPTILLARSFLKEKTSRVQTIGSFVIIAGIILVSLLK